MATATHELKIVLEDIDPPVWRTVLVPSAISLAEMHRVIQLAMGWEDYHLFQFTIKGIKYEVLEPWLIQEPDILDASNAVLGDLVTKAGESFIYEYDFGDNWTHKITALKVGPAEAGTNLPRCVSGERACPPEDCGGPFGFMSILDAIADPNSDDAGEILEWLPYGYAPEVFDLPEANHRVNSVQLRGSSP